MQETLTVEPPTVVPAYLAWLERFEATYRSVAFCCWHRLGDQALADQVSALVVSALLSRPRIFRQWGLPYSGRLAHLAEEQIAAAKAERLLPGNDWDHLLTELLAFDELEQQAFVMVCIEAFDDHQIARELACEVPEVVALRKRLTTRLSAASGHAVQGVAEGDHDDESP
jgi:hypothetical protein